MSYNNAFPGLANQYNGAYGTNGLYGVYGSNNGLYGNAYGNNYASNGCGKKNCKKNCKKNKCKNQLSPEIVSTYDDGCGVLSVFLTRSSTPTFFTNAGQIITLNYTIINTGSAPISYPIGINDQLIGQQFVQPLLLAPGQSQTASFSYTVTANDVAKGTITSAATAIVLISDKVWLVSVPTNITITNNANGATATTA